MPSFTLLKDIMAVNGAIQKRILGKLYKLNDHTFLLLTRVELLSQKSSQTLDWIGTLETEPWMRKSTIRRRVMLRMFDQAA